MQIFKTTGTIEIFDLMTLPENERLKKIQDSVGGYFEVIKVVESNHQTVVANEEGLLRSLPRNPFFKNLVGNVVVLEPYEMEI